MNHYTRVHTCRIMGIILYAFTSHQLVVCSSVAALWSYSPPRDCPLSKKQLEHDGINITVLAHAHFILTEKSKENKRVDNFGQAIMFSQTYLHTYRGWDVDGS